MISSISSLRAEVPQTEHTVRLGDQEKSQSVPIAAAAFLAGNWIGTGLGGEAEEIWSAPKNGITMGMFRALEKGSPRFYEFFIIEESDKTLILRLKHFEPDLTGWEEKDQHERFRLVRAETNALYFEGLTYQREGDTLRVWVAVKMKEDKLSELEFVYKLTPLAESI